jgi:hypothetical protein
MRCPQCDHKLWDLPDRRCPRCGRAFKPSEFAFAHDAVAFCCPDCDQAYYGRGERGHLEPIEFDCVTCGRHVHMDEMVLRPAADVTEPQTQGETNPWIDCKDRGRFKGYLPTMLRGITRPGPLVAAVPAANSPLAGLGYLITTAVIVPLLNWVGLVLLVMSFGWRHDSSVTPLLTAGILLAGVVLSVFMTPLILLGTLVWAGLTHGLLKLLGCRPRTGFSRTLDSLCYTSGIHFVTIFPCLGFYLSFITVPMWIVTAVMAVRHVQRTPVVRTILAASALPAILLFATACLFVGAARMTADRDASVFWTRDVVEAVLNHAADHDGQGPDHALRLVVDGRLDPFEFCVPESRTMESTVPVGGVMLGDLADMADMDQTDADADVRRQAMQQAIADLPSDVIAHRLGDFVLVHHGMRLDTAPPEAWVVIMCPDPDHNPRESPYLIVGRVDGSAKPIHQRQFGDALATQNQWRTSVGLAPLPMPRTVTHAAPAAGASPPPTRPSPPF